MNKVFRFLLCSVVLTPSLGDSIICGPTNQLFSVFNPGVTTMITGTSYLLVRCTYTLASTTTLSQQSTFYNPSSSNIQIFSANGGNCASSSSAFAITGDNAFSVTSTNTISIKTLERSIDTFAGDAGPRVCLYAKCISGSCLTNGMYLSNYKGILDTPSSSSSPSNVGTIVGAVIGALLFVGIIIAIVFCVCKSKKGTVIQQQPSTAMAYPMGSYAGGMNGRATVQPYPYGQQPGVQQQPYGQQPYGAGQPVIIVSLEWRGATK